MGPMEGGGSRAGKPAQGEEHLLLVQRTWGSIPSAHMMAQNLLHSSSKGPDSLMIPPNLISAHTWCTYMQEKHT